MKTRYTIFIAVMLLFLTGSHASAQEGIISGSVRDLVSGEPLVGARIVHTTTGESTITDFDGNFSFEGLSPGKHTLRVSYVSYEEKLLEQVEVEPDKQASLNVNLTKTKPKSTRNTAQRINPVFPELT